MLTSRIRDTMWSSFGGTLKEAVIRVLGGRSTVLLE